MSSPSKLRRWSVRILSSLLLFVGFLFVGSPETGVLKGIATLISKLHDIPYLSRPAEILETIRVFTLKLGLHNRIEQRLLTGLAFVVVGMAGLVFERPWESTKLMARFLADAWFGDRSAQEDRISDRLRSGISTRYPASRDDVHLLAAVVRLSVKVFAIVVVTSIALALASATHTAYSKAEVVSGILKDKLATYLTQVQLGRIPDHALGQLADIRHLKNHLGPFHLESELVDHCIHALDMIERRTSAISDTTRRNQIARQRDLDLAEAEKRASDFVDELDSRHSISGVPVDDFDSYYLLCLLASTTYMSLNEQGVVADVDRGTLIEKLLAAWSSVPVPATELAKLEVVQGRLSLLNRGQVLARQQNWLDDPKLLEDLPATATAFAESAPIYASYQDRIRALHNSALTDMIRFRVVGTASSDDEFNLQRTEMRAQLASEIKDGTSGSCYYERFLQVWTATHALFETNPFVHTSRAQVHAWLLPYLEGIESITVGDSLLLADLESASHPNNEFPPIPVPGRKVSLDFQTRLGVALRAEIIRSLHDASLLWPGLWAELRGNRTFCDGVFWSLAQRGQQNGVTKACEILNVDYPFDR